MRYVPGIYLHIPFCRQACNYCDFHFSTSLANKEAVVQAMVQEIEQRHAYLTTKNVQSIYFGGGTPSLLAESELAYLMEALDRHFLWTKEAEITLEANPDDITAAALQSWKKLGINRLSIGLQSFMDEELRWMNRAHTAAESESSVKLAQDHGFHNISIDLIYGSKFQTPQTWENTLQGALALNTPHISAYNLTIEDKTALGAKHRKGHEPVVDDQLSTQQFIAMLKRLEAGGFIQYEISNFGKAGFFAVHNSNYWLGEQYLGIGPSAHSFNGHSRQWNVKSNVAYVAATRSGKDFFDREELSMKDRYNEYILTRLRTIWGCSTEEISRLFGDAATRHFKGIIKTMQQFVIEKNGVYMLNPAGKLQADGLAARLFLS